MLLISSAGRRVGTALFGSVLLISACSPVQQNSAPPPSGSTVSTAPAGNNAVPAWSGVIDPKSIPLGDGKLSTAPVNGSLFSCRTKFNGGGAQVVGPWIDMEKKTWDSTAKVQVSGSNTWPQARYSEAVDGDFRVLRTNNLPTEQVTGNFPVAKDDPAYQYDRNPNSIGEKSVEIKLSLNPASTAAGCVDQGAIGILKNGVFLFNAVDASGRDAAAHEAQDKCDGHPEGSDSYHYHNIPSCLLAAAPLAGSTLVGFALDGYGIYIERDVNGHLPGNADLDECHGRTSTVTWNGKEQSIYHYSATLEYPFVVGCYRGTPIPTPDAD
ncbi:YHYH protein [Lentzea sp. NPDC102401]|uniref:YHYH protein n=1 Tax=Lentzea sp. NPDC102401 TaxID=3364128 RepID=UPI00380214D3